MTNSTIESPTSKSQPYNLNGEIVLRESLSHIQRDAMFALMNQYYETSREVFDTDLDDKQQVILLTDTGTGVIRGFSTMCRMDLGSVTALFSGDTIIHKDYRYTTALPRYWAQLVFSTLDSIKDEQPTQQVFWFLIVSGYKTYRYLPLFFREFYPRYDTPTPSHIQQVIHTLATSRYGDAYNPKTGVIQLPNPTPLRNGVARINPARKKDPNIAFFEHVNPGHVHGNELACITAVDRANLTRAGRRMVDAT
jgi:hypothetical protein